jgi:hypothetical protein
MANCQEGVRHTRSAPLRDPGHRIRPQVCARSVRLATYRPMANVSGKRRVRRGPVCTGRCGQLAQPRIGPHRMAGVAGGPSHSPLLDQGAQNHRPSPVSVAGNSSPTVGGAFFGERHAVAGHRSVAGETGQNLAGPRHQPGCARSAGRTRLRWWSGRRLMRRTPGPYIGVNCANGSTSNQ